MLGPAAERPAEELVAVWATQGTLDLAGAHYTRPRSLLRIRSEPVFRFLLGVPKDSSVS